MSLRLGICLVRLLGLDDCSPPSHCSCMSLRHAWPICGVAGLFCVLTVSFSDWADCRVVLRLYSVLADWGDCRIVLRLYSVLGRLGDCRIVSSLYVAIFRLGGLQDCSRSINTRSMNKKNLYKKWWFLFYMFKKLISS
jgi:hypothetical protein